MCVLVFETVCGNILNALLKVADLGILRYMLESTAIFQVHSTGSFPFSHKGGPVVPPRCSRRQLDGQFREFTHQGGC